MRNYHSKNWKQILAMFFLGIIGLPIWIFLGFMWAVGMFVDSIPQYIRCGYWEWPWEIASGHD